MNNTLPIPPPASRLGTWNFSGDCALVSGGANGIGAATVSRLVAAGATVIFGDRDEASGHALEEKLGGRAVFMPADFGSADAWPQLLAEAERRNCPPRLVVSNVGFSHPAPIQNFSAEDYDESMRANQRAMWLAARDTRKALGQRPGASLIFIGSVMARFGTEGFSLYALAKASLSGLVKTLCVEFAPQGIRVNSVVPGFILLEPPVYYRTIVPKELLSDFFAVFGTEFKKTAVGVQPLAIAGSPEDIAQAICFLHSDSARFISGIEVVVDGGLLCRSPIPSGKGNSSLSLTPAMAEWVRVRTAHSP